MRLHFANRLRRFGRRADEPEEETGQVVDLNEPVILFPAKHIPAHPALDQPRWKKPGMIAGTATLLFAFGASAGIVISSRSGSDAPSNGAAGSLATEMSAVTLPQEDLRIAPTARDSGETAESTASRPVSSPGPGAAGAQPSPGDRPRAGPPAVRAPATGDPSTREPARLAAADPQAEGRAERPLVNPPAAESLAVARPANVPEAAVARDTSRVIDEAGEGPPDTQVVALDTTPALELPVSAPGLAVAGTPESVPEPAPVLDTLALRPDRSGAGPVLLAGIQRVIRAINADDGDERVLPFLLDPVSQREVVKFVRDEKPTADLGTVDDVQFDGDEATMVVRLGFRWRGSFGVEERETRRFIAVARPEGREWQFRGVVLTGDLP